MKITVACPECHKSTLKELVELEASNEVICPHCRGVTDLTKEYWRVALTKAREALNEIESKSPR